MIETPHITQSEAQLTAAIHLTIPREQIQEVMGPAIGELMAAVGAQGIGPAGPLLSYHFRGELDIFDFEVAVPVTAPVTPVGRVKGSELKAAKVIRTIYHGPYEGLGEGWGEFMQWIEQSGLEKAPGFWERYLVGPESSDDPADWRTELNRPIFE